MGHDRSEEWPFDHLPHEWMVLEILHPLPIHPMDHHEEYVMVVPVLRGYPVEEVKEALPFPNHVQRHAVTQALFPNEQCNQPAE